MLPVQDPEGASAAKTTSSDRSGGADESGASHPSSRRHQEQVQNLEDRGEVVEGPMGPDDNLIDEMKVPDKKAEITSVPSMWSGHGADPTPSDCSGGGDGSARAPCSWSLTQEEHLRNLKNNCRRVHPGADWADIEDHPRFVGVVAKLRADPFLENSEVEFKATPFYLERTRLLHLAVLMGDLEMVQKILETRSVPNDVHIDFRTYAGCTFYSALDLAIAVGESEIVDALLEKNARFNTCLYPGSLQLAAVHARAEEPEKTSKIIGSLVRKGIDVQAKDGRGYSAFYLAVALGKTNAVLQLLEWRDKIKLNEACREGRPPIQIAHEEGFKDIEAALMECDDVIRYIDSAFRDRQAYIDAANAILVGATLIASVTFASWLQPPLNYTTSYHGSSVQYVDIEHNVALGCFWVFNSLSFYFAIGTVILGASSVLPRKQLFIIENVKKLSQNLLLMTLFLAFSMIFVVLAFGIAGFIVLIPILRYQWYMIVPTMVGGIVCVGSVGYLFKNLWEQRPRDIQIRKRIHQSEIASIRLWYR